MKFEHFRESIEIFNIRPIADGKDKHIIYQDILVNAKKLNKNYDKWVKSEKNEKIIKIIKEKKNNKKEKILDRKFLKSF